jgi:hypothetical protein
MKSPCDDGLIEPIPGRAVGGPIALSAHDHLRVAVDHNERDGVWLTNSRRRSIDRVLAADRGPFAQARRCAVLAAAEHRKWMVASEAEDVLELCRLYEERRGSAREPSAQALRLTRGLVGRDALAAYERARSAPASGAAAGSQQPRARRAR